MTDFPTLAARSAAVAEIARAATVDEWRIVEHERKFRIHICAGDSNGTRTICMLDVCWDEEGNAEQRANASLIRAAHQLASDNVALVEMVRGLQRNYESVITSSHERLDMEREHFNKRVAEISKAYANVAAAQFMTDECSAIYNAANTLEDRAKSPHIDELTKAIFLRDVKTLRHTADKLSGIVEPASLSHDTGNERGAT